MKKNIGRIIFLIAVVGLCFSGYKLFCIWKDYKDNAKAYDELDNFAPIPVSSLDQDYKFSAVNFDKLYNMNNDFIAWINIPQTHINYPVVKPSEDIDDYYLTHNFEKQENSGGAIFVESVINHPFEDENTIIHGHHMRDGSMFADLNKYKDEDFFNSNNKIYITTKNTCYTYQIFSVYVQKVDENPYRYSFSSKGEYINFLNEIKEKSLFTSDIQKFTENDKIITLSTCSYEFKDGRCLVHAKLISKKENN